VKADLALRIAQAMYMEPGEIGEDDIFSDFGLESVTLAKILDAICAHHGCTIGIAELVRRQTLREAAELIHERIASELARAGADGGAQP
jgi:acyl carrier protein